MENKKPLEISSRYSDIVDIPLEKYIKLERKSRTEMERQVTVARYRARSVSFSYQLQRLLNSCRLRPADEIGMIDMRTPHGEHIGDLPNEPSSQSMNMESQEQREWIRALFGMIGEKRFKWFDYKSRSIYDGLISGTLKETFMVEFYGDERNRLHFLTYGGAKYGTRIIDKLRECIGDDLNVESEYFDFAYVRKTMARDEFRLTLKSIDYLPEGQDEYGTVDQASMRAKYSNIIDPDAQRIKEILENGKIYIKAFGARSSLYVDEVRDLVTFRFEMNQNGLVTIYLPDLEFPRMMQDIEFENEYYNVVRRIYNYITRTPVDQEGAINSVTENIYKETESSVQFQDLDLPPDQLVMNFLRDVQ